MRDIEGYQQVGTVQQDGEILWRVIAGPDHIPGHLGTYIQVDSPTGSATSGFSGPPLPEDSRVNSWGGQKDQLPFFVLARCDKTAKSVTVETTTRTIRLDADQLPEAFGLKFLAFPLAAEEHLVSVSVDDETSSVIDAFGGFDRAPHHPDAPSAGWSAIS